MIRLLLSLLLCACSLLVVFRAPTNLTWKLAVAITEFPIIWILLVVACIVWNYFGSFHLLTFIVQLVALVLFTLPIWNAYSIGSSMQSEMERQFSTKLNHTSTPFSFLAMVIGPNKRSNTFQTITYGENKKGPLKADFYAAKNTKLAPTVIVVHGGSWQEGNGDSQQLPDLNPYLADLGYNVVSINYSLSPTFNYPAPVNDVEQVINYLCKENETFQVDTNAFVLLGRSAGGQIVLQTAYTKADPRIKGVISFYAPADMAWGARVVTNDWVLDVDKVLVDYIGASVQEKPALYDLASAPPFVTHNSPPTLLIHGQNDAMVSYHHTELLEIALKRNQVPFYVLRPKFATHGCDYAFHGPSGQLSTFAVVNFLEAITKNKKN